MLNNNFQSILIKFGIWLGILIFTCIVGISNIFALTYTNIGDKADITVVLVSTNYGSQPFNVPKNSGYNFNQVLEVDYQINNYNFEANKNYQLETHLAQQTFTNANYYTVQGLNGESCLISYDNTIFTGNYPRFAFQCPHATNNITISISNSSKQYLWTGDGIFNWQTALLKYSDTSLSGNTNSNDDIINNNNQNTQNIINNNTQNTEDIINNNNQNTQDIQDTLNDNFNSCINEKNVNPIFKNIRLTTTNGGQVELNSADSGAYINVSAYQGKTISIKFENLDSSKMPRTNYCFTSSEFTDSSILCISSVIRTTTYTNNEYLVEVPSNANYLYLLGYLNNSDTSWVNNVTIGLPKICTNKLDEQNETSKGILGKLKDLFNWLTNDDDADVSSAGDTAGWLPPGPIDSIITLPLTMLNNINSSLNKTCSPLNVDLPYVNKSVEIPCLSAIFNQITGLNSFWTWVGLISSVLILYRYLIELYKYYDRLTTLQANFISDWGSI